MIVTGQKFLSAPSALMTVTLRSKSQTQNLNVKDFVKPHYFLTLSKTKNLNVKVFLKVFMTPLFPNLITDFIHLW